MTIEIIVGVVVAIGIVVAAVISTNKDDKVAESGEDMAKMMSVVAEKLENHSLYTTVFAYWDEQQFSGNAHRLNIRTTSWNFSMSFNHEDVYLIPLILNGDTLSGGEMVHLTMSDLSLVNGNDKQTWISFYDKNGDDIVTLFVEGEVRKANNRLLDLNQRPEFEKYLEWKPRFMATINTANGTTPTHKILKK